MNKLKEKKIFQFLKEAYNNSYEYIKCLKFDKKHGLHLNIISLYGSIIELTSNCIILYDNGHFTSIPIIVRSILEAYVDLINLIKYPTYGYSMDLEYYYQWISLIEEALKKENPYLNLMAKSYLTNKALEKFKAEKKKLECKGYRKLHVSERFEKAEMTKEYKSVYNLLCCPTHNNIRSLIDRHCEVEKDDFIVVLHKNRTMQDEVANIDILSGILIDSTYRIHKFLNSNICAKTEDLKNKLTELRKELFY